MPYIVVSIVLSLFLRRAAPTRRAAQLAAVTAAACATLMAFAVPARAAGTSGDPKVALLRHDNLVSYILGTVEFMGADEDE